MRISYFIVAAVISVGAITIGSVDTRAQNNPLVLGSLGVTSVDGMKTFVIDGVLKFKERLDSGQLGLVDFREFDIVKAVRLLPKTNPRGVDQIKLARAFVTTLENFLQRVKADSSAKNIQDGDKVVEIDSLLKTHGAELIWVWPGKDPAIIYSLISVTEIDDIGKESKIFYLKREKGSGESAETSFYKIDSGSYDSSAVEKLNEVVEPYTVLVSLNELASNIIPKSVGMQEKDAAKRVTILRELGVKLSKDVPALRAKLIDGKPADLKAVVDEIQNLASASEKEFDNGFGMEGSTIAEILNGFVSDDGSDSVATKEKSTEDKDKTFDRVISRQSPLVIEEKNGNLVFSAGSDLKFPEFVAVKNFSKLGALTWSTYLEQLKNLNPTMAVMRSRMIEALEGKTTADGKVLKGIIQTLKDIANGVSSTAPTK